MASPVNKKHLKSQSSELEFELSQDQEPDCSDSNLLDSLVQTPSSIKKPSGKLIRSYTLE